MINPRFRICAPYYPDKVLRLAEESPTSRTLDSTSRERSEKLGKFKNL